MILIFVNDTLITGSKSSLVEDIISKLGIAYILKDLGEFNYYLVLELTSSVDVLHLSPTKYIRDILKKADLYD